MQNPETSMDEILASIKEIISKEQGRARVRRGNGPVDGTGSDGPTDHPHANTVSNTRFSPAGTQTGVSSPEKPPFFPGDFSSEDDTELEDRGPSDEEMAQRMSSPSSVTSHYFNSPMARDGSKTFPQIAAPHAPLPHGVQKSANPSPGVTPASGMTLASGLPPVPSSILLRANPEISKNISVTATPVTSSSASTSPVSSGDADPSSETSPTGLSPQTAHAVRAHLEKIHEQNDVSGTPHSDKSPPEHASLESSAPLTLESLVQPLLKNLLETWGADNLGPLVEREVRKEVTLFLEKWLNKNLADITKTCVNDFLRKLHP